MVSKVIDILQNARSKGVIVTFEDGELLVKFAKDHAVSPGLMAELKENKHAIIDFLSNDKWKSTKNDALQFHIKPADKTLLTCLPLSFSQERLLFIDALEGTLQYHLPAVFKISGNLNTGYLEKAFRQVVNRHEVLRTVIGKTKETWCQLISPQDEWFLNKTDLEIDSRQDEAIEEEIKKLIAKPFDLYKDPMLRANLVYLGADEYLLVVVVHHIAADGWSLGIIMSEVAEIFNALYLQKEAQLLPLPIQFADFAIWQRNYLQGDVLEKKLKYWTDKLNDVAPLQLPADFARPAIQSTRGNAETFEIDSPLVTSLQKLSIQQNNTLFVTLLAAFKLLLFRYSNQADICVGSPIAGRQQDELENLVGFFANTVALRSIVDPELSFVDWMQLVKTTTLQAFEHQEVPFEKIVEKVNIKRDLSRSPVFQVLFALQNIGGVAATGLTGAVLTGLSLPHSTSRFELSFNLTETANGLRVTVEYCTDLFKRQTIVRMSTHFLQLLHEVVNNPAQKIAHINLLPDAERQQLLRDFNSTEKALPGIQTICGMFEQQVAATPNAIACVFEDSQINYAELNGRANQLAHYLQFRGVGSETLVPICIERGISLMVGLLAILKTGAAFVPVDPEFPAERIQFMVEDSAAKLIVTSAQSRGRLPQTNTAAIIDLEALQDTLNQQPAENLSTVVSPGSLAYIIHTSGSTGKPKGVMVEHRSVVNLLMAMAERIDFNACSSFLSVTTYSFDICYLEVFMPLVFGAKLFIVPRHVSADGFLLQNSLSKFSPTHMQATPSTWQMLVSSDWQNSGEMKMLIGGEAVKEEIKESLTRLGNVWNVYGPTETTIWSATQKLEQGEKIVIGSPIDNTQIYILDRNNNLAGIGLPGEICIAGIGLARGYLNRPDLTAERFVINPLADAGGAIMYRTGDLGKWLPNGTIEYIERIDDQVKIRGYRIELGEIENVLQQSGLVKQVVVAAKQDFAGNNMLVGYFIAAGKVDKDELISYLKEKLPEYMVPGLWYELESFPLTPNGKINRKALPDVDLKGISQQVYSAPANELEIQLANIWQSFLGLDAIGVHDNFFELGGHSLLAMQVIASIRKNLGIEISLREIFIHSTIFDLAKTTKQKKDQTAVVKITLAERPQHIPLSFSQERLWFIDRLEGTLPYHLPAVLRLTGNLNADALEQAFKTVIARHEILRTIYLDDQGQPYQLVKDTSGFLLAYNKDLRSTLPQDWLSLIANIVSRPFDLTKDDMLRGELIQLNDQEHLLVVVLHHIAADGWSIQLFVSEVASLYKQYSTAQPANLPALPFQYADYAVWQRSYLQGHILENKLAYWKNKLTGTEPLQLPIDHVRPVVQTSLGGVESYSLPDDLVNGVWNINRKNGVTTFISILSVIKILLHRYCSQSDICIGTPVANRNLPGLEDLIGFFVNTLALRTQVDAGDSYDQLLQKVKTTVLEAFDYQEVPFEKVVEAVVKKRDLSRSPLFQVLFVMRTSKGGQAFDTGELQISNEPFEQSTAMFDLIFYLTETGTGMHLAIEYRKDIFKPDTIQRMVIHFNELLTGIIMDTGQMLGNLSMLTGVEKRQLLINFNDTGAAYPANKRIEHFFEEQVLLQPNATAVVFNDEELTYKQLNQKANQLAHYLQGKGVKANTLVPLFLERGFNMVVAVMAILKAGGAYVPVDPEYPAERIAFMLQEVESPFILSTRQSKSLLQPMTNAQIIDLDEEEVFEKQPISNPIKEYVPNDIGYILYTSGSTGRPKGAFMPVGALVNLLHWQQQQFAPGHRNVLQFATLNFDPSFLEIFGTLGYGGTLFLIDGERRKDVAELVADFKRFRITHFYTPYVVLKAIAEYMGDRGAELTDMKEYLVAGEQLKMNEELINFLQKSNAVLTNQYGPTEGHVVSSFTFRQYSNVPLLPPIGKPIYNTQLYILNDCLQPVPVGVTGDLFIGGVPSLAGYIKQPKLMTEKFINDPFSDIENARLYKTGDVAKWLPDGNIDFLGRKDDQVKIRGFRIELGEIESVLLQCDEVNQAAVLAKEDRNGNKRLICYVVSNTKFEQDTLVRYLKQKLPDYMVPSLWVPMQTLPVNKSGKIDKRSLPEPDLNNLFDNQYTAPRNPAENALAEIWKNLLKVERVGVYDNFFELGGHSLLATRLVSAIRIKLQAELSIRDLFMHPVIAELAELIKTQNTETLLPPLQPMERPLHLPLSFSQERLWFIDQLNGSVAYHLPSVISLTGNLQLQALQFALKTLIDRHQVLRTVFPGIDGKPSQVVMDSDDWQMSVIDMPATDKENANLHVLTARLIQQPFDLSKDFMLRATVIKKSETDHLLVINIHHIATDGWSVPIIVKEISELYLAFIERREPLLPLLPVQYADFAIWQRNILQGAFLETKLQYWKQKLQGAETLQLHEDYTRPALQSYTGASIEGAVSKEITDGLQQLSLQHDSTLFMTLLAAFKILLHKYSGQKDICVGTPIANRTTQETESLVGNFINLLAIRSHVEPDEAFTAFLKQEKDETLQAYEHQEVPFEKVIEAVMPERDVSRSPLFQVMLVLQNFEEAPALSLGDMQLSVQRYSHESTKYDITLFAVEGKDGLRLTIEYCSALYKESSISRLFENYMRLLGNIAARPDQKIKDICLLNAQEKQGLLYFGSGAKVILPQSKTVVTLFEEQAAKSEDAVALIFNDQSISYRLLNEQANLLARQLIKAGAGAETLVPICTSEGPEMIIGILGILKAGAAYVPIDPALPAERILFILKDTGAEILVVNSAALKSIPPSLALHIINIDTMRSAGAAEEISNLNANISLQQLAYVIYTSGSTGTPKGVLLQHGNLLNYLLNSKTRYILNNPDGAGSFVHLSYTFDASLTAIFMPLVEGRPIVIASKQYADVFEDPNFHINAPYDFIKVTPAHLPLLFNRFRTETGKIVTNKIVVGGEALQLSQLQVLQDETLAVEVINEYGPTEATVGCSTFNFLRSHIDEKEKSISIGKPIDNVEIFILDDELQPMPIGIAGEICIGGDGLARGYLNRADLTMEKFIPHPFDNGAAKRLYKTADLGRWLADGNIEYLGRIDDQVKIRGYRIEPGEIENVLQQNSMVNQAAVQVVTGDNGNKRLAAYIVPGNGFEKEALIAWLTERLPDYMLPQAWVLLQQMPLTANGKTDRKALPPFEQQPHTGAYIRPQTELQMAMAAIWSELLGLEQVGLDDNFFELGGDSIQTIQAVSRAGRLGYRMQPRDIFIHQTIGRLSKALADRSGQNITAEQGELKGPAGLLPIQQWLLNNNTSGVSHFNQSVLLQISKSISAQVLQQVLNALLRHHDALRFRYENEQAKWLQVYGEVLGKLYIEDLREAQDSKLAVEEVTNRYQQSLDIQRGDLVRVVWMRMPEEGKNEERIVNNEELIVNSEERIVNNEEPSTQNPQPSTINASVNRQLTTDNSQLTTDNSQLNTHHENRLLIIIHHLAVDGVSWRILLEDIELLLAAAENKQQALLPPKTSSYRQWYQALELYSQSNKLLLQKDYWQQVTQYKSSITTDRSFEGVIQVKDLVNRKAVLDAENTRQLLQDIPRVYHTGINDLLLAALARTFKQQFKAQKLLIGLEGHGREDISPDIDISRTVGWFTSLYPVLLDTENCRDDDQLIKSVKEQLRAIPDKGLGYGVLKYINGEKDLQTDPSQAQWDVLFNYLGQLDNTAGSSPYLLAASESSGAGRGEDIAVDEKISLLCFVTNGQLVFKWDYSQRHFSQNTIIALAGLYVENLKAIISHCKWIMAKGATVYTPSDFGLSGDVSVEELDNFLEEEDNILSF